MIKKMVVATLPIVATGFLVAHLITPVYAHDTMTFTTWTGPYMRAQIKGFVIPYEDETGTRINVEHYAGGLTEIRNQVESANIKWDVVDLSQADSLRACREGLLEKFDHSVLPNGNDGSSYQDDFVEGALNDCAVGTIIWATAFAYDNQVFSDNPPSKIADFFDIKKYPGKRAIRKDPSVIMEWALLADGVPPEQIYQTLETDKGVAQAFSKMNQIKANLVWWQDAREPIRYLNDGEVVMSAIWGTTGVDASKEDGSHFTMVWDGRIIELDLLGIVKGSRKMSQAVEFIKFATSTDAQFMQVEYQLNGPTRKSAFAKISEQRKLDLPNGPAHEDKLSLISNAGWWDEHYDRISELFIAWTNEAIIRGAAGATR